MAKKIQVGLLGSQFVSTIHVGAFGHVPDAEIIAVASPSPGHAEEFAAKHGIAHSFTDYKKMLEMDELDAVVIGIPNYLHCQATVDAAAAGKHVICEKPMCVNLAEADRMIDACSKAGVKLMYAENLLFTPKYVRIKELVDDGALGRVHLVKQSEKHSGPHAPHFWDVERSGGGVVMDMGCHAIEFCRWMLGRPRITSVYAQMATQMHADKTKGDDDSFVILEFEGGAVGIAEESWCRLGGMDDRAEVHGSEGLCYADLHHGNAIETYSTRGYGYAVEKAGETKGWTFTIYEEEWNYGYPQEMAHFIECIRDDKPPLVTGEDGRVVLEAVFAAYESAGTARKVPMPFETDAAKPIDLWLNRA